VTPTQTPTGSQALQVNVSGGGTVQPRPPEKVAAGPEAPPTGPSPKRGLLHSRMTSGGRGSDAPPVLRHLRMPDDPSLADAAAEILQLS